MKKYEVIIEKTDAVEYILDNVNILRARALAFSGNGQREEAIQLINDLMSLEKDNSELISFFNNTIGVIFKMQEEWEKAIEFFQKALVGIENLKDASSEIEEKIKECKKRIKLRFKMIITLNPKFKLKNTLIIFLKFGYGMKIHFLTTKKD